MNKYFTELFENLEYKIFAGAWAAVYSDDLVILFLLMCSLEIMDIFTRWLCLSMQCYKKIYPQSPCNLWISFCFMWQARKWRFINSDGLRNGFCDKTMTYLLLLGLAAIVDAALSIAHVPRILLPIVVTVLATTDALSILENLADCKVEVIKTIKEKFKEKGGISWKN